MKYIYPIDIDAVLAEGTVATTTFTVGNALSGEYYANDQNIEFGVTGWHTNDALRFDFGSNVTPDSIAIYVGVGAASITANIWRSANGTALTLVATISAGDLTNTGWYVKTFTGVAARYYIIEFTGTVGSFSPNEIYFANTFTFPYNWHYGDSFHREYGVDSIGNAAGIEFTNKRHDPKDVKGGLSWKNFNQTNIDNYETFDAAVDGTRAKFLWYDDTDYHWVKQTIGLNYIQGGYLAYDPTTGLRQQLY